MSVFMIFSILLVACLMIQKLILSFFLMNKLTSIFLCTNIKLTVLANFYVLIVRVFSFILRDFAFVHAAKWVYVLTYAHNSNIFLNAFKIKLIYCVFSTLFYGDYQASFSKLRIRSSDPSRLFCRTQKRWSSSLSMGMPIDTKFWRL